ncbi:hypothetical protein AD932_00200, partial [Gluconobacter oxydans]
RPQYQGVFRTLQLFVCKGIDDATEGAIIVPMYQALIFAVSDANEICGRAGRALAITDSAHRKRSDSGGISGSLGGGAPVLHTFRRL